MAVVGTSGLTRFFNNFHLHNHFTLQTSTQYHFCKQISFGGNWSFRSSMVRFKATVIPSLTEQKLTLLSLQIWRILSNHSKAHHHIAGKRNSLSFSPVYLNMLKYRFILTRNVSCNILMNCSPVADNVYSWMQFAWIFRGIPVSTNRTLCSGGAGDRE